MTDTERLAELTEHWRGQADVEWLLADNKRLREALLYIATLKGEHAEFALEVLDGPVAATRGEPDGTVEKA